MRSSLKARDAWVVLGAGVLVYEIVCPEGELLSEGVDRALLRSPRLTRLAVTVTALHLMNLLPAALDPYAMFARTARWRS